MNSPRHLLDAWEQIVPRLRRAKHLALFSDLDGTLLAIARSPNQVRLAPRVRALLRSIARRGVTLGVVSGRKLSDLRSRVRLRGIWYMGAHGCVLKPPGEQRILLVSPRERAKMRRVCFRLIERLSGIPGILVESKEATVAVHYRNALPLHRNWARTAIQQLLQNSSRLHLLSGKKVWELLPNSRISKWTALRLILQRERQRRRGRWLLFYLGDDATDERVFANMRGISVVVGKRRRTSARFFLRSPAEVRTFLERLREAIG